MQMEAVIEMIYGKREFSDLEEFKRYAGKAMFIVEEILPGIVARGVGILFEVKK